MSNVSTEDRSALRRTFSRGIYEFFSYLLPGLLTTYLLYVVFSLSVEGTNQYISILLLNSISTTPSLPAILLLLLVSYLLGHLSRPLRNTSRRLCYGKTTPDDKIYSTLEAYFSDDLDGSPRHEHIIDDMEEFTGVSDIPKINSLESIKNEKGIIETIDDVFPDILPISNIQIKNSSNEGKIWRSYGILKRFLKYNYAELYHRGFERYQGLLRFWETVFFLSVTFIAMTIIVIYDTNQLYPEGVVLIVSTISLYSSLNRIKTLVLRPIGEIFYYSTCIKRINYQKIFLSQKMQNADGK